MSANSPGLACTYCCCLAAGGATIWERITRHKAPVVEPRDSGAFAAALADYAAKLEDPAGTGAVLFAVCRGKVRGLSLVTMHHGRAACGLQRCVAAWQPLLYVLHSSNYP